MSYNCETTYHIILCLAMYSDGYPLFLEVSVCTRRRHISQVQFSPKLLSWSIFGRRHRKAALCHSHKILGGNLRNMPLSNSQVVRSPFRLTCQNILSKSLHSMENVLIGHIYSEFSCRFREELPHPVAQQPESKYLPLYLRVDTNRKSWATKNRRQDLDDHDASVPNRAHLLKRQALIYEEVDWKDEQGRALSSIFAV